MSDEQQRKSLPLAPASAEPAVGEGSRSLAHWERLAAARRQLAGEQTGRAGVQADPRAFLSGYGIQTAAFGESGGGQRGLTDMERKLAFSGNVERDALGVHRGCELVVGPVAVAIALAAAAVMTPVIGVDATDTPSGDDSDSEGGSSEPEPDGGGGAEGAGPV